MTRRVRTPEPERGSASVWLVACCVLLMGVAWVAVLRTEAVLGRHRAETAADVAALAAAGGIGVTTDVCAAAERLAVANAATLRSCRPTLAADGRSGTVLVRVATPVRLPLLGTRQVAATARAGRLEQPP